MLDYVIFAVTAFITLIATIIYLYPGSPKKATTVPGLDPSNERDGNLGDIALAGSFHQFLLDIHDEFGEIASFWMGKQLVVSIASAKLFKEHSHVFDRPADIFMLFEPLITMHSIQYANKADGQKRRALYGQPFTHAALPRYFENFHKLASKLSTKLQKCLGDEHIPLRETMIDVTIKGALISLFGSFYQDEDEVKEIRKAYDLCWYEMESRLKNGVEPEMSKAFEKNKSMLFKCVRKALDYHSKQPKQGSTIFADILLEAGLAPEVEDADAVTVMIASFHTTGLLLTWSIYFMATHKEVQQRVYEEMKDVLGDSEPVPSNIRDLVYLRQVLDETLRCSVLAPFAARFQDFDSQLGGHVIPANTPVLHALGVKLQDENIWPEPNKFDPERFNEENKKKHSRYDFVPFGFAGKRQCPGDQFAYLESICILAEILRKFEFDMVPDQVVVPEYGLVTNPKDEIWVTVSLR